jgi:hypothetical protein
MKKEDEIITFADIKEEKKSNNSDENMKNSNALTKKRSDTNDDLKLYINKQIKESNRLEVNTIFEIKKSLKKWTNWIYIVIRLFMFINGCLSVILLGMDEDLESGNRSFIYYCMIILGMVIQFLYEIMIEYKKRMKKLNGQIRELTNKKIIDIETFSFEDMKK